MIKLCQFQGKPEQKLVQVFHPGDIEGATRFFAMEKVAAPLLPEVQQFLESIHRDPRLIHLLINALGAGEYFGSNINADHFPEAALIHQGPDWGFETFYQAHLFKHHRNKLKEGHPSFGDVVLSVWHDLMKRVELIVKIDRVSAAQKGGQDIVDKCDQGIFFSTSMGCKVPFDMCSCCNGRSEFQKALATFNPRYHRVPANAVLEYHRKHRIPGLSITKDDYCPHMQTMANKILPDGRKVFVYNDFPRFFDISMVFIGADRTSKVMSKLASINETIPSAFMPEYLGIEPEVIKEWEAELDKVAGYQYEPEKAVRHFSMEKAAGITPGQFFRVGREAAEEVADRLVFAHLRRKEIEQRKAQYRAQQMKMGEPQSLGMGSPTISSPQTVTAEESGKLASVRRKLAAIKGAEIVKDVPAMQAIPDKTLPREILNELGSQPINHSLGSLSSLGMLLKPREFQRLIIVKSGNSRLADELDRRNQVFSPTDDVERIPFGPDSIRPVLQRLLAPFIGERSAFEPVIRRRVIRITISSEPQPEHLENDSLLTKVSALYNGYLDDAIGCMMQEPSLLQHDPQISHTIYGMQTGDLFEKEAAVDPKVLLGAIGSAYLLSRWADYQRDQAMMGAREPTGAIVNTLAKHPNVLMLLAGLGALHLQGSPLPKEILGAAKSLLMRTK